MNNVLEFINEYLHNVIGDDGEITINYDTNDVCVILNYNKYPEIPPSSMAISKEAFMLITNNVEELVPSIRSKLYALITYYKMSPEYLQSKYYKYDMIKDKIKEMEEDFK